MKKYFNNLNEILAYQLEAMYVAEKKLQITLAECVQGISAKKLKNEFKKYLESSGDKRLKLKRIFSYLLIKPSDRKSKPVVKMLDELKAILGSSTSDELKNAQLVGSLKAISHYKVAIYSTSQMFSNELELKAVSDLLSEIIAWENETYDALTKIAESV